MKTSSFSSFCESCVEAIILQRKVALLANCRQPVCIIVSQSDDGIGEAIARRWFGDEKVNAAFEAAPDSSEPILWRSYFSYSDRVSRAALLQVVPDLTARFRAPRRREACALVANGQAALVYFDINGE